MTVSIGDDTFYNCSSLSRSSASAYNDNRFFLWILINVWLVVVYASYISYILIYAHHTCLAALYKVLTCLDISCCTFRLHTYSYDFVHKS